MGGRLDDRRVPSQSEAHLAAELDHSGEELPFPPEIAALLDSPAYSPPDLAWDAFLNAFGDILLKTAKYAHRRHAASIDAHDAAMDAYAYILEKLREDDFRRLRAFSGDDEAALSRWLVVVARRLCTDFWRHRYGRARPSTPELDRDIRRRLVDEIWEARPSSDFARPGALDPEWKLRYGERRKALETSVGELEPQDQLLLALRFENGLSAQRISDLMDFPTPFHVYRRLNRLLKALKKRLEGIGVDEPNP